MYDVAIIGAGVAGGMLARTLAAYNLEICILEKEQDVAMGSTRANSGIVHAGYDAEEGSLKAKLNVRGSRMMERVTGELGVPYRKNGSMVIGFGDEDRETIERLYARGVKNGVQELRIIDGEEARRLEPGLSDEVTCALYAPSAGIVCPYELAIAAVGNAMDNGAALLLDFEVSHIEKKEDCYVIFSRSRENFYGIRGKMRKEDDCLHAVQPTEERMVCARYVVNAAGIYADEIARLAGDDSIRIHPRRGEYLLLDRECGGLVSHTIFRTPSKMGKGILITPTVDGNLLLGPTSVDGEDKEDKATTQEGLDQIIAKARENVKDIPLRKAITSFTGLRSAGNTGDFIINSPLPGFVNVAGIESPGLTAAPAIADELIGLLAEKGLPLEEKENFTDTRRRVRFHDLDDRARNELIAADPRYGRGVCRCETVTEGEILACLRAPIPPASVNGVKRRVGAGMGRCQGGFCGPRVQEILARELGVPPAAVPLEEPGSYILTGETKEAWS